MALGPDGAIYALEIFALRVRRFTLGGVITTVAGSGVAGYSGDGGLATRATFNTPFGMAVDQNGIVFISDTGNSVIRAVSPITGIVNTVAGGGAGGDGPALASSLLCN